MGYLFKKYEFDSQEQAEEKIAALPHETDEDGNEYPSHNHTIVKLGYLWITEPPYNEEGEIEKQLRSIHETTCVEHMLSQNICKSVKVVIKNQNVQRNFVLTVG